VSEAEIQAVLDQFEATNQRDFARAMDFYAEDVVLRAPMMEGIANPGTYRGKQAVGEWFGDWFRSFGPDYRFEITEARELGEGLIFLLATHGGRGRASGAEVHGENAYLYRVCDGKVTQVGFYWSREEALGAASLPEWSEGETD
jgi:ketosteroid isomerase-like protein